MGSFCRLEGKSLLFGEQTVSYKSWLFGSDWRGWGGVGVEAGKMKIANLLPLTVYANTLILLHSERPKLYGVLAILSAIGLILSSFVLVLISFCLAHLTMIHWNLQGKNVFLVSRQLIQG